VPRTHGTQSPYSLSHQLLPDRPPHHALCKKTKTTSQTGCGYYKFSHNCQ